MATDNKYIEPKNILHLKPDEVADWAGSLDNAGLKQSLIVMVLHYQQHIALLEEYNKNIVLATQVLENLNN